MGKLKIQDQVLVAEFEAGAMKSLLEVLRDLKAALDEQDRLMRPRTFDDPRIAEQDRINSLPEAEGDATREP